VIETRVKTRAAIGSNVTVMAGVTIGAHALVGAGAWLRATCLIMQ